MRPVVRLKTDIGYFCLPYYPIARPLFMTRCERLWKNIRSTLWRDKAMVAIEITRTLPQISSTQEHQHQDHTD